jgi:hypothetical protein
LKIRGARTASNTSDIATIFFDNKTSSPYTLAKIIARDPSANHGLGNGQLTLQTSSGGSLSNALVLDNSQNASFAGTISSGAITSTGSITSSSSGFIEHRVDQTDSGLVRMGVSSGSAEAFIIAGNTGGNHVSSAPVIKFMLDTDGGSLVEEVRVDAAGLDIKNGALDIAGTTVINSSRNLTNIGTISSGVHTITNTGTSGDTRSFFIDAEDAEYDFRSNSTSGYTTTFNMDNTGLEIGHNASSRNLALRTNSLDRLTISGSGAFDFNSNNLQSIGTISSKDITATQSNDAATNLTLKRNSATGRAQFALANESGTQLWRVGLTGAGGDDFVFYDGGANVLILDRGTDNATFAGDITMKGGRIILRESDDGNDAAKLTRDADEGYLQLFSSGSQTVELRGNGSSYFNGGGVGISTVSPDGVLGVQSATGQVGFNAGTSSSPERGNIYFDTDGSGWCLNLGKYQSSSFTALMTIKDNGNIGIGTESPNGILTLNSASSPTFRIKDTTNNCEAMMYAQNSDAHTGTFSNHPFIIDIAGTEAARYDTSRNFLTSGKVTVGNAAITGRDMLMIKTSSNTSDRGLSFVNSGGAFSNSIFAEDVGGNDARLVFTGGNANQTIGNLSRDFMINNQSGGTGVSGDIHARGDVVAFSSAISSDARLKYDIQDIENPLEILQTLKGRNFKWKKNDFQSSGVIAQEVEQSDMAFLVSDKIDIENPEKTIKRVKYDGFIGLLIEAVKEQQEQIEELKAKLEEVA